MKERRPKRLGRYEIRRELGRGTMGVVYEAHDPMLHRRVALKAIQLAFSIPEDARGHYETRFISEARAAAVLSHPGIVVVHDVGRDEESGTLYIALEFLEGQTLEDVTAGGTRLEWREALRIGARTAEALQDAHRQGIVHRDIKPANVMLLPSGQPKVMDFGIARLPTSQLTVAGDLFGTPSYMSPEQAAGQVADARSDVFSLGCVVYQLLTGKKVFDGPSLPVILLRVQQEDPAPPSRGVEGLPPEVDAVVARAMAKCPEERYPDALSFAEDLHDILAGRPPRHTEVLPVLDGESTLASAPAPAPAPAKPGARSSAPVPAEESPRPDTPSPPAPHRKSLGLFVGALSLVIVGFLAALTIPWRGKPVIPLPTLAPVLPTASLEIVLEHSLERGVLTVWIDGDEMLEESFRGQVAHKVFSLKAYKGILTKTIDVAPGEHVVRVQVTGGDFGESLHIRGEFERGTTRRLAAKVGGLLEKDLSLVWGPTSRE